MKKGDTIQVKPFTFEAMSVVWPDDVESRHSFVTGFIKHPDGKQSYVTVPLEVVERDGLPPLLARVLCKCLGEDERMNAKDELIELTKDEEIEAICLGRKGCDYTKDITQKFYSMVDR